MRYGFFGVAGAVGKVYTISGVFTAPSAGATCGGPGGRKALDAKGDGCPFYQTTIGSGLQEIAVDSYGNVIIGGPGLAFDPQGNLYITDTESRMLVRRINAADLGGDCGSHSADPEPDSARRAWHDGKDGCAGGYVSGHYSGCGAVRDGQRGLDAGLHSSGEWIRTAQ